MSPARWFRIVSMATVVLPVWRSPRISSRWPRPTGIRASTTLSPVWSGTATGARSRIAGASRSMGRRSTASIGPRSSRGRPPASITRPSSAGPTGTSITLPVRRTSSPARRWVLSPSTITPSESGSRLAAMPSTPPRSRSSSSARAPGRPRTRAIPLETHVMVPTPTGLGRPPPAPPPPAPPAPGRSGGRAAPPPAGAPRQPLGQPTLERVEVAVQAPAEALSPGAQLEPAGEFVRALVRHRDLLADGVVDRGRQRPPDRDRQLEGAPDEQRLARGAPGQIVLPLRVEAPEPLDQHAGHLRLQLGVGELRQRPPGQGLEVRRDLAPHVLE